MVGSINIRHAITIIGLFALYSLSFYFIEWTVDKSNYEYLLGHIEEYETDVIYTLVCVNSFKYGYTYDDIYHAHILFQAFFFSLFIFKTCKKPWFPAIIVILLNFVSIANQIRYFAGLWVFLYGMTLYDKRKILYYLFGTIACLNHIGLVVLFFIMPFYKLYRKVTSGWYFLIFIISLFLISTIQLLLPEFLGNFSKYLDSEQQSSIAGGIFSMLPFFVYIPVFFKGISNPQLSRNEITRYKMLYAVSLFSLLIIPLSLHIHLFADRFVFPMMSIWLAYEYAYSTKKRYITTKFMCIAGTAWFYLAPKIFLGYSYYLDNLQVMLGIKQMLDV